MQQGEDFVTFVCGDNAIEGKYKNYGLIAIDLKQLKALDEKFINEKAAPDQQKPSGQE